MSWCKRWPRSRCVKARSVRRRMADLLALTILTALAAAYFVRNGWRRNLLVGAVAIAALAALNVYAYSAHRIVLEFVPALLVVGGMFLAATIRSLDQETMRSLVYALGIRRRDALLGSVAESSADAIMVVGRQGHIEMANAAARVDVRVQPRSDGRRAGFALRAAAGCLGSSRRRCPAESSSRRRRRTTARHSPSKLRQPRGHPGRSAAHRDRPRHHRTQTARATRCSMKRRTIRSRTCRTAPP